MDLTRLLTISIAIFCLGLYTPNCSAQEKFEEKHIEVSLRMIGHQVLLNAGDSTSLVLPILKDSNQYKIQFATEFDFSPEDLMHTVNRVLEEAKIAANYIVEVEQCETGEVIYSYEMSDLEKTDLVPCISRDQPKSCYSLVFTLSEYELAQSAESRDSSQKAQDDNGRIAYVAIGLLFALFAVIVSILWLKRNRSKLDPNWIKLGKYHFDERNATLIMEEQRIELTTKEADLLLLLYETVNTTVEREVILNKVWGDEGDYIGRTLDVFISKLRKKLEADPGVKIVNTRGVGYKLVIDER